MLRKLREEVTSHIGEGTMLKLDRGDALFITVSPVCPPGWRQETRGRLFALSPQTNLPAETERIFFGLLKQTEITDSRFPGLVKAARGRMAVCLRTHEADPGLDTLEKLIQQIEEGSA